MTDQNKPQISLLCRVKGSSVDEETKKKIAIITTKLSGTHEPGLFDVYNKELEQLTTMGAWANINTQEQDGAWTMNLLDKESRERIAQIERCKIKNINLTFVESKAGEELKVSFKLQHEQTTEQPAVEDLVAKKEVILQLTHDTRLFHSRVGKGNLGEEAEKPESPDASEAPPEVPPEAPPSEPFNEAEADEIVSIVEEPEAVPPPAPPPEEEHPEEQPDEPTPAFDPGAAASAKPEKNIEEKPEFQDAAKTMPEPTIPPPVPPFVETPGMDDPPFEDDQSMPPSPDMTQEDGEITLPPGGSL